MHDGEIVVSAELAQRLIAHTTSGLGGTAARAHAVHRHRSHPVSTRRRVVGAFPPDRLGSRSGGQRSALAAVVGAPLPLPIPCPLAVGGACRGLSVAVVDGAVDRWRASDSGRCGPKPWRPNSRDSCGPSRRSTRHPGQRLPMATVALGFIAIDGPTRQAVAELGDRVDSGAVLRAWDEALEAEQSPYARAWVHSDLLPGNSFAMADWRRSSTSADSEWGTQRRT